jgi:cobalt-zinc-cadmium efflux system outer membrane protein
MRSWPTAVAALIIPPVLVLGSSTSVRAEDEHSLLNLPADEAAVRLSAANVGKDIEPRGDLTLADALAAALSGSPELAAYSWGLRAKDAEVLQAGKRPNPELLISNENLIGSGYFGNREQYQNTLQLSQLVELGGKRERRTKAAERARDRAGVEQELRRVELFAGTTVDFVAVVADQEGAAIAREATRHAEAMLRSVRERIKAGSGSRFEEVRAIVAVRRAGVDEDHAGHELLTSRRNLAARWGSKLPQFTRATGDLFSAGELPSFEALAARLGSAPERRAAGAEERLRAAAAALARTKRVPDIGVGLGWRQGRDWGDQTAVAELTVPLTVFNRFEGEIAAADALTAGASAETAAVEVRLERVLFALYQELRHARDEMAAMRDEIVPRSEEALALARKGYAEGFLSQLELIDAQAKLTEVRRERLRAAKTYHQLVAEVERLLGERL